MARKGNQQKNGWHHNLSNHKGVSDSGCPLSNSNGREEVNLGKVSDEEELPNGIRLSMPISESVNKNDHAGGVNSRKKKSKKFLGKEKQGMNAMNSEEQTMSCEHNLGDCVDSIFTMKASGVREENVRPLNNIHDSGDSKTRSCRSPNGLHTGDTMGTLDFSDSLVLKHLNASALSIFKSATECLQRHKPLFISLATNISELSCYVCKKIQHAYPIVLRWLMHFGNIMLLLSMVWLNCSLRGIESFLRMGTTSFLSVIWCTILSVTAMIGVFKFFLVLVTTALIGLFVGIVIASLLISTSGVVLLWFCGSFWTTALVICSGGLAFMLRLERIAMLIMTLYSVYSAWTYVGWFGLLLAFNLSFISSDVLTLFLKNNINEHRMPDQVPEQTARMEGQRRFYNGVGETGTGPSSDRGCGIPSTSGTDFETSSDDEVVRLLNCTDHYSALGLSRYESVDVTILKREYRKKAMLVHPDKNMGNEKAAEAFQKLQNAYEILLDSFKRKAYDDELRREELLNYFRRFQNTSQKNGRHKVFASGFAHTAAEGEDPFGESRRITCRKCGNFHVWILTKKSKSSARWCQDCRDFHSGKDGDGWVEQSSHPFFFGILHKVDAPRAYVCADSKIYDATEWYICQGMRSPVNTHKPSFHVNTSLTSKPSNGKGTSSRQKGASIPSPSSSNLEENMNEEEFFEWLQNAVQAGVFDNFAGGTSSESPSAADPGKFSKSGGSGSSSSKRKKKGKKQW